MYKQLTLSACIVCFAVAANAQNPSNTILSRFEFIAGPSFSQNTGYLSDYDSKTGYSLGLGYYQNLSSSFALNFRTLYEMKGSVAYSSYGSTDANGTVEVTDRYTTKFNYLTLYLLPTLQLGRNKNVHISAGGYYSFLQKSNVNVYRTRSDNGAFVDEGNIDNEDFFDPKFDAGVSFQMGYSFNVSSKCKLMLQAFCNRGLVDLNNSYFGSQRNNTYGLLLSFRMR